MSKFYIRKQVEELKEKYHNLNKTKKYSIPKKYSASKKEPMARNKRARGKNKRVRGNNRRIEYKNERVRGNNEFHLQSYGHYGCYSFRKKDS